MSDPTPETFELVRQWVAYAEEDLRAAQFLLTMEPDCPVRSVCFHSQQCIEKLVKAVLSYHAIEFPRIHDIGELVALLPVRLPLDWTPGEQRRITDYATVGRYPGEMEEVDRREGEEAVDLARKVKEAALGLLPDRLHPS